MMISIAHQIDIDGLQEMLNVTSGVIRRWHFEDTATELEASNILSVAKQPVFRVGVTGEFNTGKSTLINAIIGADVIATGSGQGTTTIPLFISHDGEKKDFTLHYRNGKTTSYSTAKQKLLRTYMPQNYESNNWVGRQLGTVTDLLGQNEADDDFFRILTMVSTTNDDYIDHIHLYWPAKLLAPNVQLVDMPGFDSYLYEAHRERAMEVLALCDAVIVAVSPEKQINSELVQFLSSELVHHKRVFFALTMVDTLDDCRAIEKYENDFLERIQRVTRNSQQNVFRSPSMLFLSEKGILQMQLQFPNLTRQDRNELVGRFESEIATLFESFHLQAAPLHIELAFKRLRAIIERLCTQLNERLGHQEKQRKSLMNSRILPFEQFVDTYLNDLPTEAELEKVEGKLQLTSETVKENLRDEMFSFVNCARKKKDAQSVFEQSDILQRLAEIREQLYSSYTSSVQAISDLFLSEENRIRVSFSSAYHRETPEFGYKLNRELIENQKMPLRYRTWKLTTFPVLRFLTSRTVINQQLYAAIDAAIKRTFDNPLKKYETSIIKVCKSLDSQRQASLKSFVNREEKPIKAITSQEEKEISLVQNKIALLKEDINSLGQILKQEV